MQIITPTGEKRELTTWYKSGDMDIKTLAVQVPPGAINEKSRMVFGIASGGEVDRDQEVLDPKGWDYKEFLKNPVLLWAHDQRELPVGEIKYIRSSKSKDKISFGAYIHDITPLSNYVWELYKQGILRAFSVGFITKKWEFAKEGNPEGWWRKSLEHELLEISAVPVPAYPGALVVDENEALKSSIDKIRGKKIDPEFDKELEEVCNLTISKCGVLAPATETKTPEDDYFEDFEIDTEDNTAELQEEIEELRARIEEIEKPPEEPKKQRVRLVKTEPKMTKKEFTELLKKEVDSAGIEDVVKDAVKNHLNLIRGRVT